MKYFRDHFPPSALLITNQLLPLLLADWSCYHRLISYISSGRLNNLLFPNSQYPSLTHSQQLLLQLCPAFIKGKLADDFDHE